MDHLAVQILNVNRIMAISTVRPDGWPQTTIVGYANRGFELFFLIYRSSQKFANLQQDDRISVAVGTEPPEIHLIKAVYAGAQAHEITDEEGRQEAWRQLMQRHSNLAGSQIPDAHEAVFFRATCKYVSVLDYTRGLGYREQLIVDEEGNPVVQPEQSHPDAWVKPPV